MFQEMNLVSSVRHINSSSGTYSVRFECSVQTQRSVQFTTMKAREGERIAFTTNSLLHQSTCVMNGLRTDKHKVRDVGCDYIQSSSQLMVRLTNAKNSYAQDQGKRRWKRLSCFERDREQSRKISAMHGRQINRQRQRKRETEKDRAQKVDKSTEVKRETEKDRDAAKDNDRGND